MNTNGRRGLFYVAFAVLFFSTTPVLVRCTHATYVNLIATQEVTGGSIILGYLLSGEVPSFNSLLGAAIALTGIAMVLI